jgi:multiple sugar transport system permease protein
MAMDDGRVYLINQIEFRKTRIQVLYFAIVAVAAVLAALCFLPILWVIISSLEPVKEFYSLHPPVIPNHLNWSLLGTVWSSVGFLGLYANSGQVVLGSVIMALLFNSLLGYVLSRLKPRGTKFVFLIILWTLMLPNTTAIVPVYKNIIDFPILHLSLVNTYFPMWLMAGASAFNVIIFKSFFDSIPTELIEAAQIDGSSNLNTFFRVMLPLSKPVFLTITIFTVTGAWSDFFWPFLVLNEGSKQTVMVALYGASTVLPANELLLALTLGMLPPMVVFIFLQRYIMQGFTLSGIKG